MPNKKEKIFLNVKMPGEASFSLAHFRGVERLSAPFEYTLFLTCENRSLNFDTLMGQSATVSLSVGSEQRTYNGIIGHFEQDDSPFKPLGIQTNYRAILYPKFWLLNFSGQCRIFQNKSALTIIKSILEEHKIPYANQVSTCGSQTLDYCVQYNETDFAFVSRLMETEGIFYFFQQGQSGHKLVLADSPTAHTPCPNAASAGFNTKAVEDQAMLQVSSCLITRRIVPAGDTLKSYNYLTPQTALKAPATGQTNAGGGTITVYNEIYDQQSRGDALAKIKLQSQEYVQKMVNGISTVPFFLAGYKFKLKDHPRDDANMEYALYEVIHEARLSPEDETRHLYENTYTAFPATVPFKAPQITPKPYIYGTQTAKVTGKDGEEIYTEEYGRIKVKFHWDPSDKTDDSTSCWIRVATLWSGQSWGTLFTPRVGQEVVVSFIDGDPDKPLIVGSVYNGKHKPPYLPTEPTKSTIKSQSSKVVEGEVPGYNEFRFEDKKGSEQVYLHAQKDLDFFVQNDWTTTISDGNRTTTLKAATEKKGNDSLTLIKGDKSLKIEKGNQAITLMEGNASQELTKGNNSLKLTEGNNSLQIVKGDYTIDLSEGSNNITLTKGGYSLKLVEGSISITCLSGGVSFDVMGGDISLKTSNNVSVNAAKASVNAQTVSVEATKTSVSSAEVSVNSTRASVTATTSVSVNAPDVNVTASSAVVTAGSLGLTGGSITAGVGTFTVNSPLIALNGFVTINGLPPMVV